MQWHQLDHMQKQSAPRSRQITKPTPHHSIFKGRMLFLMPNQHCQSTEGNTNENLTAIFYDSRSNLKLVTPPVCHANYWTAYNG